MGGPRDKPLAFVIDNFDSFTWNVASALYRAGAEVLVRRADALALADIEDARPDLLVISPGPGRPEDATLSLDAVRAFAGRVPVLGVCLGHQCVATAFGGRVGRADEPVHGKARLADHDGRGLFAGIASPMEVGRYHSLRVVDLPDCLEVSARAREDGSVMALRHRSLPVAGVQFHPDSFLTPSGLAVFENALHGLF